MADTEKTATAGEPDGPAMCWCLESGAHPKGSHGCFFDTTGGPA